MSDDVRPSASGRGTAAPTFGPPYNWCDRQCERCPISMRCPLFRKEVEREWKHLEAGGTEENQPDWASEDLEESLRLLEHAVQEEGVEPSAPPPERPVRLDAKRLEQGARELMVSGMRADGGLCAQLVLLIGLRTTRIAGYLQDGALDDERWMLDAAPNLLLVERSCRALRVELEARAPDDAGRQKIGPILAELTRLLEPSFGRLGPARPILEAMLARGEAPSPFCIETLAPANS